MSNEKLKSMHDQIDKIHQCATDEVNADVLHRFIDEQESELTTLRAKLERLPADWATDSSLKTWFPFTADTLDELDDENRTLRAELEQLRAYKAECEGQEPIAYIYPWDAEKLKTTECFVQAFSIPVGCPEGESTFKLYAHTTPSDRVADRPMAAQEKADLIMGFVNQIAAAYEAGFTPYPYMTLQQLHRVAQHHVKDELGLDVDDFTKSFGVDLFDKCRSISAGWDKPSVPAYGPSEHDVYLWFQESTIVHHIEEDGGHISKRAMYLAKKACEFAMLSASPAPTVPAPDGWKLVPIVPTRAMWDAVNKLDDEMAAGGYDGKGCSIEQVWDCLLSASPESIISHSVKWFFTKDKLPIPDETVWVCVKNKNKPDGIWLHDICSHDGESWAKRTDTWEDIVAWAYPVDPFSESPAPDSDDNGCGCSDCEAGFPCEFSKAAPDSEG